MRVPVNLAGQSYQSRSQRLSNQVTRNFYPEIIADEAVKSRFILQSFPGMSLFGTDSSSNADRGMFAHKGALYKVTGNTLYRVGSGGVHTSLGGIAGSARCIFTGINNNVVIVTEGTVYIWDGTNLAVVADNDLEAPNAVTHINNQVVYDGDGGRFATSDVGDATSINGLNYATAEIAADELIRPFAYSQVLYLFGEQTIESWWNSGNGNPPFDRIEQGLIPVGLGALHSVDSNDRVIYFLGDDSHVYRMAGYQADPVTHAAMHSIFSGYGAVSDAIGWCFTMEGQSFYAITFPTADKTWCFSETAGLWFEISSGTDGGRSRANSYAYCYRKHLVADYQSGNIYEWSPSAYSENGDAIVRVRDSGPIHGGLVGQPGVSMEMNSLELIMETGVGLVSGQGSNPAIVLQVSDDGGRTWSTEMLGRVGKIGQYVYKVSWHALGSFYDRIVRIKTSDPVLYTIHAAVAEVELGI